jgi:Protein of unknown function (DUF2752)
MVLDVHSVSRPPPSADSAVSALPTRGAWPARLAAGALLGAIVGTLLLGAMGTPGLHETMLAHGPRCIFRTLTGVDCPFCGMTRATLAMGSGDLTTALHFHPLAPLMLAGTAAVCAVIVAGRAPWLFQRRIGTCLAVALALSWALRLAL